MAAGQLGMSGTGVLVLKAGLGGRPVHRRQEGGRSSFNEDVVRATVLGQVPGVLADRVQCVGGEHRRGRVPAAEQCSRFGYLAALGVDGLLGEGGMAGDGTTAAVAEVSR